MATASQPLTISVVIAVYNGERFLDEALRSVSEQTLEPLEVIVVDDGSTDGSAAIAQSYENVVYVPLEHQGIAAARNTGIATARGDIVVLLDSDDYWPAKRLSDAVAYFIAQPELGYLLGKELMFVEPGHVLPSWAKAEWLDGPQDASGTCVLAARRETFAAVGPFNPEYEPSDDTEWLLRASKMGIAMARQDEIVIHRRLHDANITATGFVNRAAMFLRIARDSVQRRT